MDVLWKGKHERAVDIKSCPAGGGRGNCSVNMVICEQERIEAARENKEEAEAAAEEAKENASNLTNQVVDADNIMQDVEGEVKKMLKDQELLEEEIKGILINTQM